jgi:hypothetical protein
MIDVIVVGLLVNLAASAFFYSIQGRLDNWKRTRPMLAHSLGGIFIILAVVAFLGIRMLSKFSVEFEDTKIYLPRPNPQIYLALPLPLLLMLFSVLEVSLLEIPSNTRSVSSQPQDQDEPVERAFMYMHLTRPVETAFLVGVGIVGYKMVVFSEVRAINFILMSILMILLMGVRVMFSHRHDLRRLNDRLLLTLITATAWSAITLIFWL